MFMEYSVPYYLVGSVLLDRQTAREPGMLIPGSVWRFYKLLGQLLSWSNSCRMRLWQHGQYRAASMQASQAVPLWGISFTCHPPFKGMGCLQAVCAG
jgi:hypothetical protein